MGEVAGTRGEVVDMEPLHNDDEDAVGRVAPAVGDRARIKFFKVPPFRLGMGEVGLLRVIDDYDVENRAW